MTTNEQPGARTGPAPGSPASEVVVVVGQGYVGLPVAMRAVEQGYLVVGYDVDEARVKRLASGDSFVEDVPAAQLRAALDSGRYVPTTDAADLGGFDVAVITVPTPLHDGVPDLAFVEQAARTVGASLRRGACVVLESTTYPGTTEELVVPILEEASGLAAGSGFAVGYSPERIDPGNPTWTFVTTPKVVSGIDDASLARVAAFYGSLVDRVVPVRSPREAELCKLLENTFRHVNIALINEIAMFAGDLDIDVWQTIEAASTKPFGFMAFTPGPGVGGHCLPIDPSYLSWQVRRRLGHSFRFVELANDVNEHMPQYVLQRLTRAFNDRRRSVNGSRVLLLGLAYKANSSDARESPARRVLDELRALGADVRVADPHVRNEQSLRDDRVEVTVDEVRAADVVLLLTDHDAFDYDLIGREASYIFDTRHRFPAAANVEHL